MAFETYGGPETEYLPAVCVTRYKRNGQLEIRLTAREGRIPNVDDSAKIYGIAITAKDKPALPPRDHREWDKVYGSPELVRAFFDGFHACNALQIPFCENLKLPKIDPESGLPISE